MSQTADLSRGRHYLAIPGPSVIPEAVLQAMHRPSPNIYKGELVTVTQEVVRDLKKVARTEGNVAIYIGNGHAAWEAALSNVLMPGEKVLVPVSGRFGFGWAQCAQGLGIVPQILDFGTQDAFDAERIEAALRADTRHEIKAVLAVHVDTSSSVRNDIAALRNILDRLGHPALLMVDCIASLGCDPFEMDLWGVDVMVAACQKGLMTPAGMAFVFFNARAAQVRATMPRVSQYWDWTPRAAPEQFYLYFCGTAPTHHLYGLRVALGLIMDEGLEAVWARHALLAQMIWTACDAWGQGGALALNVADPSVRAHSVTTLRLPSPMATRLRDWTEAELGLTLGIGLKMAPHGNDAEDGVFRLGHMGHLNGHMVLGLLGGVQAGLEALSIPYGPGALEAAARVVAGSER